MTSFHLSEIFCKIDLDGQIVVTRGRRLLVDKGWETMDLITIWTKLKKDETMRLDEMVEAYRLLREDKTRDYKYYFSLSNIDYMDKPKIDASLSEAQLEKMENKLAEKIATYFIDNIYEEEVIEKE